MKEKCLTLAVLAVLMFAAGHSHADILDSKTFSAEDFAIGEILERDSVVYSTIAPIAHPATVYPGQPGDPELPAFRYLYSLPYGTQVDSVIVTDWVEKPLAQLPNKLHPLQEAADPDSQGLPPFTPPGPIYSQSGKYPAREDLAGAVVPVSFVRGAGIATVQIWPVRFDPQTNSLTLVTSINITIAVLPAQNMPLFPIRQNFVGWHEELASLEAVVENSWDAEGNMPPVEILNDDAPEIPGDCIIITSTELAAAWVPYRDWMMRKGIFSEIVSTEEIYANYEGFDDPEKIKNFIRDKYLNDGVRYVLFGGNVSVIPRRLTSHDGSTLTMCDLYYAEIDDDWDSNGDHIWGDPLLDDYDIGSEVIIGRIPAENVADVNNWWNKRYRYENNPGNGNYSYLSDVTIAACDDGLLNGWYNNVTWPLSEYYNINMSTLFKEGGGFSENPSFPVTQDAVDELNAGVHIFEILNHGLVEKMPLRTGFDGNYYIYYEDGWLAAEDLQGLNPGPYDHITFAVSCLAGYLDYQLDGIPAPACFAQVDLVSPGGSVAGRYNSRSIRATDVPSKLDGWTIKYMLETNISIGRAHYLAKLLFPQYEGSIYSRIRQQICANNFLGCPEMKSWSDEPHQLLVTYPANLHWFPHDPTIYCPNEIVDIAVTEMIGGQPVAVPGALVTLYKDGEVYKRCFADMNGNASLSVRSFTAGTMSLICTKRNYIPFQAQIPLQYGCVIDPDPPQERPGRGKTATVLPALIWNPLDHPSGDSLFSSLAAAGYAARRAHDLDGYIDSLANYHLFISAGVYYSDSLLTTPVIEPYMSAILPFLANGGSLYWEGALPFNYIDEDWYGQLSEYFWAAAYSNYTEPFYCMRGADMTPFGDIDSIGYDSGGRRTHPVISDWRERDGEVLFAPEASWDSLASSKAAFCQIGQTHTMLTNFSWSRLHDGYTNTRVDLIHDIMEWLSGTVGVEEDPRPAIPAQFSLSQNYPNPFNAATTIEYALPRTAAVRLEVFDILGQRVATLVDGPQLAGFHRVAWNAAGLSSGLYFARLQAGEFVETKKLTLLK
jgi:hypothetical protein